RLEVPPQLHQQPPGQGHNPDPPDPAILLAKALLVPPTQRTLRRNRNHPQAISIAIARCNGSPPYRSPAPASSRHVEPTKDQKVTPTGPFSPVLLPMIVARGAASPRSEERRVGKECRSRGWGDQ